jgi:hypothetical protein
VDQTVIRNMTLNHRKRSAIIYGGVYWVDYAADTPESAAAACQSNGVAKIVR